MSPYSYVQNSPVNRVDPTGALDTDSDDWFQNSKTGEVYYNSEMRKGDESMLGDDWEHLGENGMFTQDEASTYGAEISLIARNGGSIEYNQSNNSISGELMLESDRAEKFMDKQGYRFTETVRFVEEYSDVTMSPDAQTISDNWSKVVKKQNHRYVSKDRKYWINIGSYRASDFSRLNDQRTRTVNHEIYQLSNKKGLTKWQQTLLKVGIEVYKTGF